MALADTRKIMLTSLTKYQSGILELLHNARAVQIENLKEEGEELQSNQYEYQHAQLTFALTLLEKYKTEKPSFKDMLAGKIPVKQQDIDHLVKNFDYLDIINQVENLEATLNQATSTIDKLNDESKQLQNWIGIDFVPRDYQTRKVNVQLGSVASNHYQEFIQKIGNVKTGDVKKVSDDTKEAYLVVTSLQDNDQDVKRLLSEYDFKPAQLPRLETLPKAKIESNAASIKEQEKVIEVTKQEITKLTKHQHRLMIVFDYITWKKEQTDQLNKMSSTSKTFSVMGWIDADHIKLLEEDLQKVTKKYALAEIAVKKDVPKPVALKNSKIFRPFESVTNIYGMPKSSEIDPTPFLAPFFIIFFGLCLTDAGYGVVLALLAWGMIKIMKIPIENQRLLRLLMIGGIFTFIIGAIFGGWFGLVLEDLPDSISFIREPLINIRQINPLESPLTVMMISFVLGIIQVLVGLGLDVYWKIKQGNKMDGLLGSGVNFLFLLIILFWASTKAGLLPEAVGPIATYTLYAGVVLMIVTQGRKSKNIVLKFFSGTLSLYNLVGFLSDILSYSRLLALGLATGIIAMVVNLVAMLFKDMIPFVGWGVAVLILIGGHLFNLAINTLGAFIHSGRLQFVEFFPKFMEGGGTRLQPFKKESKYIRFKS
ncbi:V-type ATP synthase subunit I [Patescibacteria group bacterium]|nr:V-type ATP synthase subunit I [Patescibacteria group bacterium]